MVKYDNGRSELWSALGEPHPITELRPSLKGVWFDDARDHAFAWYNDRTGYLLDLAWLEKIRAGQATLGSKELIGLACEPLRKSPNADQLVQSVSKETGAAVCP